MRSPGFYPGFVTGRYHETWDFYTEHLGFRTLFECETSVLLQHPCGVCLELLRHETNGHHAELVCATDGHGFWLNLESHDIEADFRRWCAAGLHFVQPLEARSDGRLSLTLRDPNGVLICIASPTAVAVASPVNGETSRVLFTGQGW